MTTTTMTKRNNSNREIADKYEGPQTLETAVKVLKSFSAPKFDQTIDVCFHLGIDPRQADQQLRGSVAMPKGVGQTKRVIAFCAEDKVDECKSAGAVEAGGEDLVQKVQDGWFDFDIAVASPDMMRTVSALGRVLGPKGLMPSPKAGTVAPNVAQAVTEYSAGKVSYRNDDGGNIHCVIGKMSFSEDDILENLRFFVAAIEKMRPAAVKGHYIKKCTISATMTPGIQLAVQS